MRVAECSFDTLLYEGASTLVYAGIRDADGARVIAKLARDDRRNLTHEYLVLQKVAGPGIVEAFGVFEASHGPVLIQRRFGSGSLADALRGGRFAVPRALRIALQLAQVLARIHAARIVHRDIEPANTLYDADAEVIALGDFGAAAELPVNARALPAGDLVGTPGYVSPEQTGRTSEGCDVRSDLYSLGATLYELLTGTRPFVGDDALEVVAAHLSRVPATPSQRVASIPMVVSDVVMKLLAKMPDERYQSARGLAADLERCLETLQPDGRIPGFALGRSDLLRPRFPARLFGRGDDMQVVDRAFARAATGVPTLVLISGRDGSGRTELVRALIRQTAASPFALGGWSRANQRPLAGLGDALGSLAHDLLRLDDDRLAGLRNQFAARIGQVGQVLLDVAPALGDVFGPQPELVPLDLEGARGRLHHGFRCLAGALGHAAPVVLALRGFEHADPASRSLVEAILDSPAGGRVLVVLIAHDPAAFGTLRHRPDAVSIELGPLPASVMIEWTQATLACAPALAAELGGALHEKAAGNPLMFVRLLEHLVETGVVERKDFVYAWSIEAVHDAPPPPTLGALASQRIAELGDDARRAVAAIACGDDPTDAAALAAMLGGATTSASVAALVEPRVREGLVVASAAGYRITHPVIVETALAAVTCDEVAEMRGRLGRHLLAACGPPPTGGAALRVAMALSRGATALAGPERHRAALHYVVAAEHVMTSAAYEVAATLFTGAGALLDEPAAGPGPHDLATAGPVDRGLRFRSELGQARALMMLGRNAEADARFQAMSTRELSPAELGVLYPSWCDNHSMVMDRARAVELGLEGLARLGVRLPAQPSRLRPLAAIRLNQRYLGRLTAKDHVERPEASDDRAIAAVRIVSTVLTSIQFLGRIGLYVLAAETAVRLFLDHGHQRSTAGFLALHAAFLHAILRDYAAARRISEAYRALEAARPAPERDARGHLIFHYLVGSWFGPWHESATWLSRAVRVGVEAGDPVFAALCASASITMLSLTGAPLDRLVATIEGWGPVLRGDGGAHANAANVINIAGKLSRGEPITSDDLDRVSRVPRAAGSMRNNAMVNLGLALAVIGHEPQVRAWLDEIRAGFPQLNFSHPHIMTIWLLDGLFAAKDARSGKPERRADAERMLEIFRMLKRETGATNNDPAMAVLEAQLLRAGGEIERAAGMFGRAARAARAGDMTPLVAYASEQRAQMLDEAGFADEAMLFYGEAILAYRRWGHRTKAHELEATRPGVRARDLVQGDDVRRMIGGATPPAATVIGPALGHAAGTMVSGPRANALPWHAQSDPLDLVTVLEVSKDITTQLTSSGVVRAVLTGIARNAGAERVVLVLRTATGPETVHGEVDHGTYREIDVPLDDYAALPKSVVRAVRRTGRPLVVADAMTDPGHAADPFVVERRGRSIAGIPVRRKGEVTGLVVLENAGVAGAFTPGLVSLTQALVAQAAIALDNAALYEDLENRVAERSAALEARTAEMRMVLDHVAQGLVTVGTCGRLFAERSAILATWFPDGMPDTLVGLFRDDPGMVAWLDLAWEQLITGFLPLDLALHQLPAQLRVGDRTLALAWQPIVSETGTLERVLVVLSDVTAALRLASAERDQHQLAAIFHSLSEDRNGVVEFVREAKLIVADLARGIGGPEIERRLLHTLKGNAALFGLSALAARCHDIEDAMALDSRPMTEPERASLAGAWNALYDQLSRFIDVGRDVVRIRRADYEAALAALVRDGHPAAHDVALWALEPLRTRLERLAEPARALD